LLCIVLGGCILLGIVARRPLMAILPVAVYMTSLFGVSVSVTPRVGIKVASRVPVAMATIHIAYGLGFLFGMYEYIKGRYSSSVRDRMSSLSR
jgi:uncharacterized membrane protein YdbT with pleckstrin-like domain